MKSIALSLFTLASALSLSAAAQNRPVLSPSEPIVSSPGMMYPGANLDLYTNTEWEITATAKNHCDEKRMVVAKIHDVVIQIKGTFDVNSQGKTQAVTYPHRIVSAMVQCRER